MAEGFGDGLLITRGWKATIRGDSERNPEAQIFRNPGFGMETWQNKVKVEDSC